MLDVCIEQGRMHSVCEQTLLFLSSHHSPPLPRHAPWPSTLSCTSSGPGPAPNNFHEITGADLVLTIFLSDYTAQTGNGQIFSHLSFVELPPTRSSFVWLALSSVSQLIFHLWALANFPWVLDLMRYFLKNPRAHSLSGSLDLLLPPLRANFFSIKVWCLRSSVVTLCCSWLRTLAPWTIHQWIQSLPLPWDSSVLMEVESLSTFRKLGTDLNTHTWLPSTQAASVLTQQPWVK